MRTALSCSCLHCSVKSTGSALRSCLSPVCMYESVSCCHLVNQHMVLYEEGLGTDYSENTVETFVKSKTHGLRNRFFSTLLTKGCSPFIRYMKWMILNFQRLGTSEQDQLCLFFLPLMSCGSPGSTSQDPSRVRRHGLKTTALNQRCV